MFKSHAQTSLFTADHEYAAFVGKGTFYGFLAEHGYRLFPDESFAALYCQDNGRPCASPCMLTKVMLLQMFDGVSDAEAVQRATFDLRWKVALGIELEKVPFAKSTLQQHRARLHLNPTKLEDLLKTTLEEAKRLGILKRTKMTVALDTTPVFGRGAVKDTYNLVADGIKMLCRALCMGTKHSAKGWAFNHDFRRYWDSSSVKGMAAIDWSNDHQRQVFLTSMVADVDRILLLADEALAKLDSKAAERKHIAEAAALLRKLVEQDVEKTSAGAKIREGTAKDRIVSTTDPEMRHGRKSASKRFEGHKAGIAVETEGQMITAVEVPAGNSADQDSAMDLVKGSEANTGLEVEKTIGDCAYGSGETRQQFAEANRELVAKVPSPPKDEPCHKWHFNIDIENNKVTCPAGRTTQEWDWTSGRNPDDPPIKRYTFPKNDCAGCPLAAQCTGKSYRGGGRAIFIHPQESLLQAARKYQKTEQFREDIKARQVVEHRFARLTQLGIRQARYFGRAKTKLQVTLAAVVANLTRLMAAAHASGAHVRTLSAVLYRTWALMAVVFSLPRRPVPAAA